MEEEERELRRGRVRYCVFCDDIVVVVVELSCEISAGDGRADVERRNE